jgi:hypothetical protein
MADINDQYIVKADEKLRQEMDDAAAYFFNSDTESDSSTKESVLSNEGVENYKEALQSLIDTEVQNAIDEEIKKAKQELITEQRKAIVQIIEENKAIIRELVGEEKNGIKEKAAELRKSILSHISSELSSRNS